MYITILIMVILFLLLVILTTKYYYKSKLKKQTKHINTLERQLLSKKEILLENIKLASLGRLLENITHQWRQPLAIINAVGMEMTFKQDFENLNKKEVTTNINLIESNVLKLSETIDNFSFLFQNSKEKSYFNLMESFTYITDILQPQIYEVNIQIIVTFLDTEIHTYKSELMQVFMHILNHCIEILSYHKSRQNGIFATLKYSDENIIIQIYDSTKGIPKEYLEDIFDLSFNAQVEMGFGSGLYACKRIVEDKLEGTIIVDSHAYIYHGQGYVGTKFCIEILKNLIS